LSCRLQVILDTEGTIDVCEAAGRRVDIDLRRPAARSTRTAPPPITRLSKRSGLFEAANRNAKVPTSGATMCACVSPKCFLHQSDDKSAHGPGGLDIGPAVGVPVARKVHGDVGMFLPKSGQEPVKGIDALRPGGREQNRYSRRRDVLRSRAALPLPPRRVPSSSSVSRASCRLLSVSLFGRRC
jgi:hypothetical protein